MENIYQPSIKDNDELTKSFAPHNLYVAAFIGGIFFITWLGIKNAKRLKLEKQYIQLLTTICCLLIIAKFAIIFVIGQQIPAMNPTLIKLIGTLIAINCCFIFSLFCKKRYRIHMSYNYKAEPIWSISSILLCIILWSVDTYITASLLHLKERR